ncbi:hypothetical protein BU16DRAFT_562070 [Lophium mytilinum]|uniref:Uncharacterized protein n=1 Tax=Lophium mytilinum TaxID=390894 RepID=A0A6A6QPV5_9PEZI|nr:hypothetical protein BU16DRAFT_562070 [Lophium mytilinum]
MSTQALETLPAEIRQQIVANTITVIVNHDSFHTSTPLNGVCKTLQADITEVLRSWLPGPNSLEPIPNPLAARNVKSVQTHYEKLAEASNREWRGIEKITILIFGTELPRWVHNYFSSNLLEDVRCPDWISLFHELRELPETVKCVHVDLTPPPAMQEFLERYSTMQQLFWYWPVRDHLGVLQGLGGQWLHFDHHLPKAEHNAEQDGWHIADGPTSYLLW